MLRRIPAVNWAFSRLRPVPHSGNIEVAQIATDASPAITEDVAGTAQAPMAEISADPVREEADLAATTPVAENDAAALVVAETVTEEPLAASSGAESEPVAASDLAVVDDDASVVGISAEIDSAASEEIVISSADLATASADRPAVIIEAAPSPDISVDAAPVAAEAIPVHVENVAAVVPEASAEIDPAPASDVPPDTAIAAVANESSSAAGETEPAPVLMSPLPEIRSVPKVRARVTEPADRAALIRQRWAESGIRMWNPRLHGTGEAALNIQGSIGLLPPAPGETMPRYDKLEFRMLGGQIVCEGVIVEAPVQASHRSFTRLAEPRTIERMREPARERQAVLA
ncbi:hypothetical protein [Bradyrhizobium sp. DOA9]|uniref:hypothetical protein n=1 Tax=Bradyrhizobium sp. DOA9 TaxID=1126627 RepID=UPI000469B5BF|nr:hypothetical protein [Bradyrhizobium sp. DOA9]